MRRVAATGDLNAGSGERECRDETNRSPSPAARRTCAARACRRRAGGHDRARAGCGRRGAVHRSRQAAGDDDLAVRRRSRAVYTRRAEPDRAARVAAASRRRRSPTRPRCCTTARTTPATPSGRSEGRSATDGAGNVLGTTLVGNATTLTSQTDSTHIVVASATGLNAAGTTIYVGAGATAEAVTVASAAGTTLTLNAPGLTGTHAAGEAVTNDAALSGAGAQFPVIKVASVAGFARRRDDLGRRHVERRAGHDRERRHHRRRPAPASR